MSVFSPSHASIRRSSVFVTAAALGLVVLADLFFYRHELGWTVGAFAGAMLLALVFRPSARRSRKITYVILLAVAALVLTLVEEPTPLAIYVTCVAIVLLAMTSRQGWTSSALLWLERWSKLILLGWTRIFRDTFVGVKWVRRHPGTGAPGPVAALWVAAKWIVPILLGSVFVWLFSLANPIVERWLRHGIDALERRLESLPDVFDPERILFWLIAFVVAWAVLRVRTRRLLLPRPQPGRRTTSEPFPVNPDFFVELNQTVGSQVPCPASAPTGDATPFSATPVKRTVMPVSRHGLVERCLIVFNIVFAMETILDLLYLAGGRHLPRGITYKEYAHRGSYPLIATALLAAAFVLIAFGRQCRGINWRRARWLVYVWIAQNVLLMFSAGWRLLLLVNASNLTRWRLSTTIWLGLVAIGLVTIVWRILTHRDNAWLLRVNISMTAIVLYACCFLNLDGFIANYNADHCLEVARNGDVLGLTYLRDIGIESIPALDRLSHSLDTPDRRAMAHRFAEELRGDVTAEMVDWRGWTLRRARLHKTGRGSARLTPPPTDPPTYRRSGRS